METVFAYAVCNNTYTEPICNTCFCATTPKTLLGFAKLTHHIYQNGHFFYIILLLYLNYYAKKKKTTIQIWFVTLCIISLHNGRQRGDFQQDLMLMVDTIPTIFIYISVGMLTVDRYEMS